MSANAETLQASGLIGSLAEDTPVPKIGVLSHAHDWSPEHFAREQIRSLVRRVFFANERESVKQVVFCAVGENHCVANICDRVGEALALETSADVAILGQTIEETEMTLVPRQVASASIKSWSTRAAINLWRVPEFGARQSGGNSRSGLYWVSCLARLRNEFEYAIIHGPAAGISSEAALLAELTDGVILVLGANGTRRATARKIKETLEGAKSRILGTVLSERSFPIPERIYRHL